MRGENYKKEVRRQIRLFVIITLGFTIAFAWRQTLFDFFKVIIDALFPNQTLAVSSFLTSLIITIISLLLIVCASYFLKEK